jgi:hypothetical protein
MEVYKQKEETGTRARDATALFNHATEIRKHFIN